MLEKASKKSPGLKMSIKKRTGKAGALSFCTTRNDLEDHLYSQLELPCRTRITGLEAGSADNSKGAAAQGIAPWLSEVRVIEKIKSLETQLVAESFRDFGLLY